MATGGPEATSALLVGGLGRGWSVDPDRTTSWEGKGAKLLAPGLSV